MKTIKKIGSFLLVIGIFFTNTGNILAINASTMNEVSEGNMIYEESETIEDTENVEESTNVEQDIESSENIEEAEESISVELNNITEDSINSEEQELLFEFITQHNTGNGRSLMSEENIETKDFLTTEQKEEAFIVVLEENLSTQQKLDSITDLFEVSDGKRIDAAVDTVIITKDSKKSDVEFATEIQNIENVQIVEKARTFTVELEAAPNDPYYSAASNNQWELKQMQMESVWDIAKGAGVKIGVYDVGFAQAYGYPKEFNRLLPLVNFSPNSDTSCYTGHTHGTTVISIAGGVATNNGVGMASIANEATFQPYLTGFGCSPNSNSFSMSNSDFTKVYTHAINNKVDILNMSFGDSVRSSIVDEATKRAYNQGLFIVASRGNSGNTVANYPACSEGALAVGALNQYNEKASFSSYGDCGHGNYIMAYGQNVSVTVNGGVGTTNGTSFSSPIVAGILGIMKSVNPSATNQQLLQALKDTTRDLGTTGFDQNYGYGMIQPLEAVKKIHLKIFKEGNIRYYLNDNLIIQHAEVLNNAGGVVNRIIYQSNTIYGKHTKKEKYIFKIKENTSSEIEYMNEYNINNQWIRQYRYHAGITVNNYIRNYRYVFKIKNSTTGEIDYMDEYNAKNQWIRQYRYHAGITVNNYIRNYKYIFKIKNSTTGEIDYMDEYNAKNQWIRQYRYHVGITVNNYIRNYKYIFKIKNSTTGEIDYMDEYNAKNQWIRQYRYHVGITVNNYIRNYRYVFKIKNSTTGEIDYMDEYNAKNQWIRQYRYHAGITVNNYIRNYRYVFKIKNSTTGEIDYMDEYNTKNQWIRRYYYHTGITVNNYIKNYKYIFKIKNSATGEIDYMDEYNTKNQWVKHQTYPAGTIVGKH